MLFDSLRVKYVRNINNIYIEPAIGLNLVVGPNASGKTALLEAIHMLSRARSFRTPRIKEVIQKEQLTLQVSAQITNKQSRSISTGIEKGYGTTSIRYEGKALKTVSEQANNIPLLIITPDSHTLVTGAPRDRRHWLDWAMFHVEPTYIGIWRNYQRALRNRNNLLKQRGTNNQLSSWESSMLVTAKSLGDLREEFIEKLQKQLSTTVREAFSVSPCLSYYKGCPAGVVFEEYLEMDREKDRQAGHTRFGPHKADVCFLAEEHLISTTYSRGQTKRFVVALLMAQAMAYEEINSERPVFLIDDYASELDVHARMELLNLLKDYKGQIFLTSTETNKETSDLQGLALFHVEHGAFNKVVK